jgi:hypothetical protein
MSLPPVDEMSIHWIFCVVCGGPPEDPCDDLVTSRVAQESATLAQLQPEYLEVRNSA